MKHEILHFSNKIARRIQKFVDLWAMKYWHNFPFGNEPKASKKIYLKLWEEVKRQEYPEIDEFEQSKGFVVEKKWYHNLALHTQITIKDSKLCYQHGRVLYTALSDYLVDIKVKWNDCKLPVGQQMVTILETGTARGFSAVVMARAISDLDVCGKIITLDLLPHDKKMYWNCIDDNDGVKTRRELLSPWQDIVAPYIIFIEDDSRSGIKRTAMGRVNFAFLDGAHTYDDIMIEFDMVRQLQEEGDVIIFDDYNPSLFPGIVKGVDTGCNKWGYSKTILKSRDNRAYVIAKKQ